MRMLCNPRQLPRDAFRRQHKVLAHPAATAFRGIESYLADSSCPKSNPTLRLDGLQPQRAIRCRPRKDYPDRPLLLLLGQRLQKKSMECCGPAVCSRGSVSTGPAPYSQPPSRENLHKPGWASHRHLVGDLPHRHRRGASQTLRQRALMDRVQIAAPAQMPCRYPPAGVPAVCVKASSFPCPRANAHDGRRFRFKPRHGRDSALHSPGVACWPVLFLHGKTRPSGLRFTQFRSPVLQKR